MSEKIINNANKFIVAQSNELIEAHYSSTMTARAHKVARLIFSLISPDDQDLRTYTISIDALKSYLGMKPNIRWGSFRAELEDIQDRLNDKPVSLKTPDGDYIRVPFVGLTISPRRGVVIFEISTFLKPYLLALRDNYTSYLLINIPKLKSAYSIRLYELLHQYRKIGKRSFELGELQKKVGSSYNDKYNNFKRRVLLQAQKDLKKHTDLAFVFDEVKEGRKVVGIQFVIFGNQPEKEQDGQLSFLDDALHQNDNSEQPALSEAIVIALNTLGISEQNIAQYLAKGWDIIHDPKARKNAQTRCETIGTYYLEKIEYTKMSSPQENAAGFLIRALQGDWVSGKALQNHKKKAAMQERKKAETRLKSLEDKIEELNQKKKETERPIIKSLIDDNDIFEKAYNKAIDGLGDFMKSHISSVRHLPIRDQYAQKMSIEMAVNFELIKTYPDRFTAVIAINDEIKKLQNDITTLKKKSPYL